VDDSSGSGLNYSRIDVYSAILSLDETSPDVNLISPQNSASSTNASLVGSLDFANIIEVSAFAVRPAIYGMGYRVFTSGLPSDLAEGFDELRTDLLAGIKQFPPRWVSVA